MNDEIKQVEPTIIDTKLLTNARLNALTISKKRQKIILGKLTQSWNKSKACYHAGITYAAYKKTIKNDPQFAAAVQEIHDTYLNIMEESSVSVGSLVDARGFNDRKLNLQAHRSEVYAKQPEIQANVQVNIGSGHEITSILQRISPKPE